MVAMDSPGGEKMKAIASALRANLAAFVMQSVGEYGMCLDHFVTGHE
jgi:hypothetical protein